MPLHFDGYATVYESPYEMWDMFGPYTEVVPPAPPPTPWPTRTWTARWCWGTTSCAASPAPPTAPHPHLGCDGAARAGGARPEDEDVEYIAPKIAAGLIDEMSFCFRITAGQWSPDYTEYRIEKFDLHRGDVAIVGFGANPATTAALRSASPAAVRLALAAAL